MSSLKGKAIDYITTAIHHNEISDDDIITEARVCDKLGISRTPVREALVELTAIGIIERVPNKGYRIKANSKKDKADIYEILGVLDGLAAKDALLFICDDDIKEMKKNAALADVAIEYEDYSGYCRAQDDFHNVYITKCNNPALINEISEITKKVSRYAYYSDDSALLFKAIKEVNLEHKHIIELFEKKDGPELQRFISEVHWNVKHDDMI